VLPYISVPFLFSFPFPVVSEFFPFPFFRILAFPELPDNAYTRYPVFSSCTFSRYRNNRFMEENRAIITPAPRNRDPNSLCSIFPSFRTFLRSADGGFAFLGRIYVRPRSVRLRSASVFDPRPSGRYDLAVDFSRVTAPSR
jgi:hypothetical protein